MSHFHEEQIQQFASMDGDTGGDRLFVWNDREELIARKENLL